MLCPLNIVGEYHLNTLLIQLTYPFDRLLGQFFITMNTTNMTEIVLPFTDLSFLPHDPSVMARITCEIYTVRRSSPRKNIDMSR